MGSGDDDSDDDIVVTFVQIALYICPVMTSFVNSPLKEKGQLYELRQLEKLLCWTSKKKDQLSAETRSKFGNIFGVV